MYKVHLTKKQKAAMPKVHITEKSIPYVGRRTACGLVVGRGHIGRIHIIKNDHNAGRASEITCQRCRQRYGIA